MPDDIFQTIQSSGQARQQSGVKNALLLLLLLAVIGAFAFGAYYFFTSGQAESIATQGKQTAGEAVDSTIAAGEDVKGQVTEGIEGIECPQQCNDFNDCTEDVCGLETQYTCQYNEIIPCCGDRKCTYPEECSTCEQDCGTNFCIGEQLILTCEAPCPFNKPVLDKYQVSLETAFNKLIAELGLDTATHGTRQGTIYPLRTNICIYSYNCADVEFVKRFPTLYTFPGFKEENRSVIYIL
ncbi:MAG: hypothetical protein GOV15_01145, partial [Candidatus Diapherotrites archaeon]|nr:hypothetical protein [Candidatus Diapherotrites archaeon]